MRTILHKIADDRRRRIDNLGFSEGVTVPAQRQFPLVPFGRDPFIICEVKRRSPSRGVFIENPDPDLPVRKAKEYRDAGIKTISVLTERDYFGGTLDDLIAVKSTYPDLSILRKDFILCDEDIDISYRAGADAILLIAALLSDDEIRKFYRMAQERGLSALVEVHTEEEVDRVRPFAPHFTGINCRDLKSFQVDRLLPLSLGFHIDWKTSKIYESGILSREEAEVAFGGGFNGVLIGEAAMKKPELIPNVTSVANGVDTRQRLRGSFWRKIAEIKATRKQHTPLVKICGITNRKDAEVAVEAGADILGVVLAPSPRQVLKSFAAEIANIPALKVAVVVTGKNSIDISALEELINTGMIDAIQFHGEESPEFCSSLLIPYYRALSPVTPSDVQHFEDYHCPRILVDASTSTQRGGTGKRVLADVIMSASKVAPLWLAGGITPANIQEIIEMWHPELVDLSSGVESSPGVKDHRLIKTFFEKIAPFNS